MADTNDETLKPDALNDLFRDLDDLLAATPESALPAPSPAPAGDLDDELWRSLGMTAAEAPAFLGTGFESAPVAERLDAELASALPAAAPTAPATTVAADAHLPELPVPPAGTTESAETALSEPEQVPVPELPVAAAAWLPEPPETPALAAVATAGAETVLPPADVLPAPADDPVTADFDFDRLLELPEPSAAAATESAEAAPSEPELPAAAAVPPPPAFDAEQAAQELLAQPLPELPALPDAAEMTAFPGEPALPVMPPPGPERLDVPFPELTAAAVAAAVAPADDADDATGWFNRGNDLRAQGALGRAAEFYERAIALDPDCIRAYCNLAGVLAEMGERREALTFLQAGLKRDPGNAVLKENLAGLRRAERRRRRW